jgi:hypothetical protein
MQASDANAPASGETGTTFLARLDRGFGIFAEAVAAVIVIVEIVILSAGVFAACLPGDRSSGPTVASSFSSVAMLGSVVLRRGGFVVHVSRMSAATGRRIDGSCSAR